MKRAIFCRRVPGGALAFVWFSSAGVWAGIHAGQAEIEPGRGRDIQQHTNDYALVQANLKKIADVEKKMAALDQLATNRFLQGNLMNALQQTYVPNVQLSHVRVNQAYSSSPAIPSITNSFGVVPGRPPGIAEHVTLTMDAKDFSSNPGDQVNHYKDALFKQDYFNHNLASSNGVRLSGLSALQSPGESKPFVMFTLECRYQDKTP